MNRIGTYLIYTVCLISSLVLMLYDFIVPTNLKTGPTTPPLILGLIMLSFLPSLRKERFFVLWALTAVCSFIPVVILGLYVLNDVHVAKSSSRSPDWLSVGIIGTSLPLWLWMIFNECREWLKSPKEPAKD